MLGFAQDSHLKVAYQSTQTAPKNITVCGAPDTVSVVISLDGTNTGARTNLQAKVKLFPGIRLSTFVGAGSTAGVSLVTGLNTGEATFNLPSMSQGGVSSVVIRMGLIANCEFTDTININPDAEVQDTWTFTYDLDANVGLSETDVNAAYRDAVQSPFFTMGLTTSAVSPAVGTPFSRQVLVSHSGLNGYVSGMTYTNLQGPGIWVRSMTVNGLPVTMTKVRQASGDTLITVQLNAIHFALNTIGGNASNGNGLFEKDEQLKITEDAVLVSCTKSRTSRHTAAWGCSSKTCESVSKTDFIYVGDGTVQVGFLSTGLPVAKVNVGYCQQGVYPARFTNQGIAIDPGTANMMNVSLGFGLGDGFNLLKDGFRISALRVAGVLFENPDSSVIFLNNHPLFNTDVDGPGGLTDLDGDGFFDDLAPNNFIDLIAYVDLDCSMTQQFVPSKNSTNNLDMVLNAKIDHTNFCGERVSFGRSRAYSATNVFDTAENCTDPDVQVGGTPFTIMHTERRNVFNFDKKCEGEEKFIVTIPMQTGFVPEINACTFSRIGTAFPLFSNEVINDTLYLIYSATGSTFINGDYTFNLVMKAECDAPLGQSSFDVKIAYWCPPCDCKHTWYQSNITGPYVHENPSVCPENLATCDEGLRTTSFEVNRTTFGYTSDAYLTHVTPNETNTKIAISCDSVNMVVRTVVGQTPLTDSVGIGITYINVTLTDSVQQIFLFDKGVATIKHNGSSLTCNIDSTNLKVVIQDSIKILYFSLNDCVAGLGITLMPGDSIIFSGMFSINPDGPFKDQFTKIPEFRGFGYHINDGDTSICESYGANFKIAKIRSLFSFPSSSSMPKGCTQTDLNYRVLTVNNNFKDFFGEEYRAGVKVDSIKFRYDKSLLTAFDKVELSVSIPGHPTFVNNFFTIHQLDTTGYFVARFDTLTKVPSLNANQSFVFNLRMRLVPSCRSLTGSALGNNRFDFDPVIYYTDRYYAKEIGDGSCARIVRDSISNDIVYTEPPVFGIAPVTNPAATPLGDTATWVVKVCNSSTKGDAKATFFSVVDSTGIIEVLQIEDITDPLNVRNLTVQPYGDIPGLYFTLADGFKIATSSSTLNDICNTLRIKARVSACENTSFKVVSGYSCSVFDTLNYSPDVYPPCTEAKFDLSVNTEGANLDASFLNLDQVDLTVCDTVPFEMVVRNTDLGPAQTVNATITLPLIGGVLLNNIEIAWPSSAAYVAYPATAIMGTPTLQGQPFNLNDILANVPYLSHFGLPGFNPVTPNDSNEIKIRFQIGTDCNFTSGRVIYQRFGGESACGGSIGGAQGNSQPLYIEGTNQANLEFDVNLMPGSALSASGSSKVNFNIINTGATTTGSNDYLQIVFPDSLAYLIGSAEGIFAGGWNVGEPIVTDLGEFTQLEWPLPSGMTPGQSALFSLVLGAEGLTCSDAPVPVRFSTIRKVEVLCQATGTNCSVDVLTSQDGESLAVLPISESPITLVDQAATSICDAGNTESAAYHLSIKANQALSNFELYIFADANDNDSLDAGENTLWSQSVTESYATGDIFVANALFDAAAADLCQLKLSVLLLDADCPVIAQSLNAPQLLNAGDDATFCADGTNINQVLGKPSCGSGYTYTWTAIAPAQTTWLSDAAIAQPNLVIPSTVPTFGSLSYVLATTRIDGCAPSYDTVVISRNGGISIQPMSDVFLIPGSSAVLMPIVSGGQAPYSYNWAPTAGLTGANTAEPTVQTLVTTVYTVTVTDNNTCSATASIKIVVDAELNATVTPENVLLCEGESQTFVAGGGNLFTWLEDPSNPQTGLLSAYNIQNPTFSGGTFGQIYKYKVVVGDTNLPGITDTVGITITIKAKLNVTVTGPQTAACGDSITLVASGGFMYVWFNLDDNTFIQAGVQSTYTTNTPQNLYVIGTKIGFCHDTAYYQITASPDSEAPMFSNIPDNLLLTCGDPVPPVEEPTVSDNCDQNPTVTFVELPFSPHDCNYVITRQWTATDDAGNTAVLTQTITFEDTTPPTLVFNDPLLIGLEDGDTLEFSCFNPPIISSNDAVAVDACDGSPSIVFSDYWTNIGTCSEQGYLMIMYCGWTATDACGNTAHLSFYVKLTDNTPPVIISVPEDVVVPVTGTIPAPDPSQVLAIDNCDTNLDITYEQTSEVINCYLNVFRTWIVTDNCGNTATALQTIIWEGDTIAPVITPLHPFIASVNNFDTIVLLCTQTPPAMGLGDVSVSIDCNDYPTVFFHESVIDSIPCTESGFLRLMRCTWEAFDGFGNASMYRIWVKIIDTVPPVINQVSPNLYLAAFSDVPTPLLVSVTDDCDENPNLLYIQDSISINECVTLLTRTWVATDHCGNADLQTQQVYIMDSAGLLSWNGLSNGQTLSLNCNDNVPVPGVEDLNWGVTCLINPVITLVIDTLPATGCTGNGFIEHYVYSWTANDQQGVQFVFSINVEVVDNTPPSFNVSPEQVFVTSADLIPAPPALTASDNCDAEVNITFYESSTDSLDCLQSVWRTWIAIDDCGNISVATQQITLQCDCQLDLLPDDSNLLVQFDCNEPQYFCTSVMPDHFDDYTFLVNGNPYTGQTFVCEDDTLVEYDLDSLPEFGNGGPYFITNWLVNGQPKSGSFFNTNGLLDSLAIWDPAGNWELWPNTNTICGDANNGNVYGPMTVLQLNTGQSTVMQPFIENMPMGVEFEFGTGTHYFEAIDNNTGCRDTTYIKVVCVQFPVIQIQTYVTLGSYDAYCLGQIGLGNITSVEEVCPNLSGDNVLYTYDEEFQCYYYDGLELGTDSLCLYVCLDNGLCAMIYLQTTVIPSAVAGQQNLIANAGQVGQVCLDADELLAGAASITCINDPNMELITFDMNAQPCLAYQALSPGQTQATFVICDSLGICDTIVLNINVQALDMGIAPLAVNDSASTLINKEVVINVLQNDAANGQIISSEIIVQPQYGQATWPNSTQPIVYIPYPETCNDNKPDEFKYRICNTYGCSEATVFVQINCHPLTIFNGFSPNGDGVNDAFHIDGLQNYPDNYLRIFNRWGNEVFSMSHYDNNWKGTFGKQTLTAGTYFYQLDDGKGKTYTGWVQIHP